MPRFLQGKTIMPSTSYERNEKAWIHFLNSYFYHPAWDALDRKEIRCTIANSPKLIETKGRSWFVTDVMLRLNGTTTPEEKQTHCLETIRLLASANSKQSSDIYFYPQLASYESSGDLHSGVKRYRSRLKDEHIDKILWLILDFDDLLPVGIKKIFDDLGIKPWMLWQSSHNSVTGQIKYQALIAVQCSEEEQTNGSVQKVNDYLITTVNADKSAKNPSRLFRLPAGLMNWKLRYAQDGVKQWGVGAADILWCVHPDNTPREDRDNYIYTLQEVRLACENFRTTDTGKLLLSCAQEKDLSNSVELTNELYKPRDQQRNRDNLAPCNWREALQQAVGFVPKGQRHNALVGWSSQLAYEAAVGRLSLDEALENFEAVCKRACEAGDEILDSEEYTGLVEWLKQCSAKDSKERAEQIKELMGGLADDALSVGTEAQRQAMPSEENYVTESGGYGITEDADFLTALDYSIEVICSPTTLTEQASEHLSPADGFKEYIDFLGEFLLSVKTFIENDGYAADLRYCLLGRMQRLGMTESRFGSLFATGKTAWGSEAGYKLHLSDKQMRGFVFNLLEHMCRLIGESEDIQEALKQQERVRDDLIRIHRECLDEAMDPVTGVIDDLAAAKKYRNKVNKYFKIPLRDKHKRIFASAMVEAQTFGVEGDFGKCNGMLVYQNGVLWLGDLGEAADRSSRVATSDDESGEGRYRAGDKIGGKPPIYPPQGFREAGDKWLRKKLGEGESWQIGSFAIAAQWQESVAREWKEWQGRGVQTSSDIAAIMRERCPMFSAFLEDCFPGDEGTWALVLKIMGYTWLVNNPAHKFFNFYGIGGSGKTTLATIISKLGGRGGSVALQYSLLSKEREGVDKCFGKNIIICDEAEDATPREHEKAFSLLRLATGGGTVRARGNYEGLREAKIGGKFIIISNALLGYKDVGGSGARRHITLLFEHRAPSHRVIVGLDNKILAAESDVIATLAGLAVWGSWHRGASLLEVAQSRAATEGQKQTEKLTSPLRAALRELLVPAAEMKAGEWAMRVPLLWLKLSVLAWLRQNGGGVDQQLAHTLHGWSNNLWGKAFKDELQVLDYFNVSTYPTWLGDPSGHPDAQAKSVRITKDILLDIPAILKLGEALVEECSEQRKINFAECALNRAVIGCVRTAAQDYQAKDADISRAVDALLTRCISVFNS